MDEATKLRFDNFDEKQDRALKLLDGINTWQRDTDSRLSTIETYKEKIQENHDDIKCIRRDNRIFSVISAMFGGVIGFFSPLLPK